MKSLLRREGTRRVAHLPHDIGGTRARLEQERGERSPQAVVRSAGLDRLLPGFNQFRVGPFDRSGKDIRSDVLSVPLSSLPRVEDEVGDEAVFRAPAFGAASSSLRSGERSTVRRPASVFASMTWSRGLPALGPRWSVRPGGRVPTRFPATVKRFSPGYPQMEGLDGYSRWAPFGALFASNNPVKPEGFQLVVYLGNKVKAMAAVVTTHLRQGGWAVDLRFVHSGQIPRHRLESRKRRRQEANLYVGSQRTLVRDYHFAPRVAHPNVEQMVEAGLDRVVPGSVDSRSEGRGAVAAPRPSLLWCFACG